MERVSSSGPIASLGGGKGTAAAASTTTTTALLDVFDVSLMVVSYITRGR